MSAVPFGRKKGIVVTTCELALTFLSLKVSQYHRDVVHHTPREVDVDCSNISKDEKRLVQTVCMNMSDFEMIATGFRGITRTSTNAKAGASTRRTDPELTKPSHHQGAGHTSERMFLSSGWDIEDELIAKECSRRRVVLVPHSTTRQRHGCTSRSSKLTQSVLRQSCRSKNDGREYSKQIRDQLVGAAGRLATGQEMTRVRASSELQIEERRQRVQQARERSTCRSCGQTGHWAGDETCSLFTGFPKGQGHPDH